MSTSTTTSTEERALALLGQGCGPEMVASALGVSPSRISQLLSDSSFAEKVAALRFENLARHNARDQKIDKLEDLLLDKLENILPFLMDPMKLVAAFTRINAAKRRGASAPEQLTGTAPVVALNIPSVVINQYKQTNIQVNVNNQVVKAGSQDLVTVPSSSMDSLLSRVKSLPPPSSGAQNVPQSPQ